MLLVFNGQQFWEHSSTRPPAGRVMLQLTRRVFGGGWSPTPFAAGRSSWGSLSRECRDGRERRLQSSTENTCRKRVVQRSSTIPRCSTIRLTPIDQILEDSLSSRTGLVIGVLISECAAFRIAGDEHRARRLGLDFIC